MILDAQFDFSKQQALSTTDPANSTNVHDAAKAQRLFGSGMEAAKLAIVVTEAGGTSPTIRAQFVGADDNALSSNVVTIAETGVRPLVAANLPEVMELRPMLQRVEKRFYGIIYTLGGTTPTAKVNAQVVMDNQTANLH